MKSKIVYCNIWMCSYSFLLSFCLASKIFSQQYPVIQYLNEQENLKRVDDKFVLCNKVSRVERSVETILIRKKRYIIYPAGSGFIITASMVKALITNYPTGYNLLGELDVFYPLPDKTHYKNKNKEIKPASKSIIQQSIAASNANKTNVINYAFLKDDHDNRNYDWQYSFQNHTLSEVGPNSINQKIWDLGYENELNIKRNSININESNQKGWIPNWKTSKVLLPLYTHQSYFRQRSIKSKSNHMETEYVNSLNQNWDDYQSFKDHLNLYEKIEIAFSRFRSSKRAQVRACILRLICESQHDLLPKGKSLFQDVLRILFTLPVNHIIRNEYMEAMYTSEDAAKCTEIYGNNCQISILNLILTSVKLM